MNVGHQSASNIFLKIEEFRVFLNRERERVLFENDSRAVKKIDSILILFEKTKWWCVPIECESVPVLKADRTKPLFLGPLFTSEKHPWPTCGDQYMEPIVQFDLNHVGKLSGIDLGSGMLQLWLFGADPDEESFIRVIPKTDINESVITDIPASVHIGSEALVDASGHWDVWLEKDACCLMIKNAEEKVVYDRDFLIHSLNALTSKIPDILKKEIEIILSLIPEKNSKVKDFAAFFGSFNPIQYEPEDCPPCLLSMESGGGFQWGSSLGNAQIFYRTSKSGIAKFKFLWSH
jgi:hypothetical protein